jgi:hypothetical protein
MDVRKVYQASELVRIHGETKRLPRAVSTPTIEADPSVRVAISKSAGLLNKLSSLQDADATQFRYLMGEVGSNLKAAANPESGAVGADLGELADRLLRVAESGDLSYLQSGMFGSHPDPRASAGGDVAAANRAVAAYRRNLPSSPPSRALAQALEYVSSAADNAGVG